MKFKESITVENYLKLRNIPYTGGDVTMYALGLPIVSGEYHEYYPGAKIFTGKQKRFSYDHLVQHFNQSEMVVLFFDEKEAQAAQLSQTEGKRQPSTSDYSGSFRPFSEVQKQPPLYLVKVPLDLTLDEISTVTGIFMDFRSGLCDEVKKQIFTISLPSKKLHVIKVMLAKESYEQNEIISEQRSVSNIFGSVKEGGRF